MDRIVAVIPARYDSTRFPGKPLAQLAGKSMIRRVYEAVTQISEFNDVLVATDDKRIQEEVLKFNGNVVMTDECSCGTERVYKASRDIDADIIINVQGDEPLIKQEMILDLLKCFEDESVTMATLKKELTENTDIENPNVVKVITDKNNDAIYFSRYAVPFVRETTDMKFFKHIGIYGYRKTFLEKYVSLPESGLEKAEKLEQLRVLENGYKIRVVETKYDTVGVDTPEQLQIVEQLLLKQEE